MDWEKLKNSLPNKLWDEMDEYCRYAYLKTFIPYKADIEYGFRLRELLNFLK